MEAKELVKFMTSRSRLVTWGVFAVVMTPAFIAGIAAGKILLALLNAVGALFFGRLLVSELREHRELRQMANNGQLDELAAEFAAAGPHHQYRLGEENLFIRGRRTPVSCAKIKSLRVDFDASTRRKSLSVYEKDQRFPAVTASWRQSDHEMELLIAELERRVPGLPVERLRG